MIGDEVLAFCWGSRHRLKEFEKENGRLWRAVSDLMLDKLILKEVAERNLLDSGVHEGRSVRIESTTYR